MSPTQAQIEAMGARGYRYSVAQNEFRAGGTMYVNIQWNAGAGSWEFQLAVTGYAPFAGTWQNSPEAAADSAEAYLRHVLSGFRFPWLEVKA